MADRQREEVLNVKLAECICERGMVAAPENILNSARTGRALPDVIVSLGGLRCIIEGKVGDVPDARRLVEGDARERVADGIAHLAVAVVYPAELREAPFTRLKDAIAAASLAFLVVCEATVGGWNTGNLDSILEELRRAYDILIADDVLERSVQRLQIGMQELVSVLSANPVTATRLADVLGVYQESGEESDDDN